MEIKKWAIAGIAFTLIIGSLFHFIYGWSGENPLIGIFGSTNESVWEHLKLLFWPMFFFSIIEYVTYGKKHPGFVPAKVFSILLGMALIIIIFYTYAGIIGEDYLIVDIATFIFAVITAYCYSYRTIASGKYGEKKYQIIGWILMIVLIVGFIIFTFSPPEINLFLDPVSGEYGI